MARTAQDERLVAIEGLQAGVEMTARVLVVDLHRDVDFHTAERVDRFLEAVEVDFRIMRDGNACELRNDLNRVCRAADRVRRVELLLAVRAHVDERIAMERHHSDLLVLRVDAREDHAVGAELIARVLGRLRALLRAVGAHEQHVERVASVLRVDERIAKIVVYALVEVGVDGVDIGERGADSSEHHHQKGDAHRKHDLLALLALSLLGVFRLRHATRVGILRRGEVFAVTEGRRRMGGVGRRGLLVEARGRLGVHRVLTVLPDGVGGFFLISSHVK